MSAHPASPSCSRMWVQAPSKPYVQPWNPQTNDLRARPRALRGAGRGVDQPAAAVHAHVVVCRELGWPRAHDDDRVVEDVVGQVAADLGQFLDPADLLPDLAPQLDLVRRGRIPVRCRPRRRPSSAATVLRCCPSDPPDGFSEGLVLQEQGCVVGAEVAPLEVQTAVDEQRLAGDVAGQVGQQEQDRAGLLLGTARAGPSRSRRGPARDRRRCRCATPRSRSRPARSALTRMSSMRQFDAPWCGWPPRSRPWRCRRRCGTARCSSR